MLVNRVFNQGKHYKVISIARSQRWNARTVSRATTHRERASEIESGIEYLISRVLNVSYLMQAASWTWLEWHHSETTQLMSLHFITFVTHYSCCGCRFLHLLGTFPCTKTDGDSCDGTTFTNINRGDYFHDFNSYFRHHVLRQCYNQSYLVFYYVSEVSSSIQRYSRSMVRSIAKTPITDHSVCNYHSLWRESNVST